MPNLVNYPPNTTDVKTFANIVAVVGAGASRVMDARGMNTISVITGGGTATVSRVDSDTAGADAAETAGNQSVAATTKLTIAVDWAFYRITATTATCRVSCV